MHDVRAQRQRRPVYPAGGAGHAGKAAAGLGADIVKAHAIADFLAQAIGHDQGHLMTSCRQRGALFHENADVVARVGRSEMGYFHTAESLCAGPDNRLA